MSEEKRLLTDLRTVGDALTQSDLPSHADQLHILGAVVKVLEHEGIKVADELLKKPEPAPAHGAVPAEAAAPAPPAGAATRPAEESRLDRIEHALAKLLERDVADAEGTSSTSSSSSPPVTPTPSSTESSSASSPSSPGA